MRTKQDFVSFKDEATSIAHELQPPTSSSSTTASVGSGHSSSSSDVAVAFAAMTRDILEDLQFYSTSATDVTQPVIMNVSSTSEEKILPEIVFEACGVFLEGSHTAYIHRHQMLTLYQEYFGHNSDPSSTTSSTNTSAFAACITTLGLTLLGEVETDRTDLSTTGQDEASAAASKAQLLSLLTDLDTYESLHTHQVTTCRAKDTERGCAIIPDYKHTNPVAKEGVEEVDTVVKASNSRLRGIRCLIEEVKRKYTLI